MMVGGAAPFTGLMAGLMALVSISTVASSDELPFAGAGRGSFVHLDVAPRGALPVRVHTYVPPPCVSKPCPLVISMHGLARNAVAARDNWIEAAEANDLLIAAPEFDKDRFPTRLYQLGGVQGEADRGNWVYSTIERLFDRLKDTDRIVGDSYVLFGHSAGAQFVHRMALLMPEARYSTAVIGNAGYYTLPLSSDAAGGRDYPYSLGNTSATIDSLRLSFGKPMLMLLGDQDNDPEHHQLNNSAGAKAQGPHRLARGQFFFAAAQAEAKRRNLPFNWRMVIVPGVAHEQTRIARAAAKLLFGK
jgi:poly(3-hydroxybutyrate) depolymerase